DLEFLKYAVPGPATTRLSAANDVAIAFALSTTNNLTDGAFGVYLQRPMATSTTGTLKVVNIATPAAPNTIDATLPLTLTGDSSFDAIGGFLGHDVYFMNAAGMQKSAIAANGTPTTTMVVAGAKDWAPSSATSSHFSADNTHIQFYATVNTASSS